MIIVTEICKIELFEFFVTSQSFCEAMVSRYMKQLCEAISYLHRNNILHLNVKPENILLDENSTLKLINFGSAHRMNEDSVIYWNRGTPEFVAPEVVTSCQVTTGTDMWSVGVVTYLALTGVSPFAGETDQMTLFRIRDFDEKLNFKHFHQISESGKDFVSMLIVMSQSSRLSADDVINHEWMASSVEKKLETERLKYFQSRRKWQRSLLTGKSTLTIRSMTSLLHGEYGSTSLAVPRHVIDDVTSSTTVTESEDEEPPLVPRPNPTPTIQISSPLTSPAVERREIFKAGRSLSGSMERPLQLKEDRSKPPEGRRLDLLQVGKKNNESKQHHLVGRS
uniref:Protein kinase domain-containing protein n=1 Tax=Ciona intestinalis TaxID=7719 RepID=H2XU56_CIOIN